MLCGIGLPLVSWTAIGTIYTSMFSNNQLQCIEVTGMTMPVAKTAIRALHAQKCLLKMTFVACKKKILNKK